MLGAELLFFLSALAFAVSARGLLAALTNQSYLLSAEGYSRRAQKMGRQYKIAAWGLLTLFLFGHMVVAFIETFLTL